jgi:hypothetical protein
MKAVNAKPAKKTHNLVFVMFDGQRRTFADLTGLQEPPDVSDFGDAARRAMEIDKNIHRWICKPVPTCGEFFVVIKHGDRWHGREVSVTECREIGNYACVLSSQLIRLMLAAGAKHKNPMVGHYTNAEIW